MNRLDQAVHDLQTLARISSTLSKTAYLDNLENEDAWYIIKVLLDNSYSLGLKTLQPTGVHHPTTVATFDEFMELVELLNRSNINDSLRNKVQVFLSRCNKNTQDVLSEVLKKKYKVGVAHSLVNKVRSNFIPVFACMLADTIDETEYKFPVRVDIKYNGVRCLAIVEGSKCTLFTRQGRVMEFPLIEHEVIKLAGGNDLVFDGELETMDEARTAVSGICNSNIQTGYTSGQDNTLTFKIWDVIPLDIWRKQDKSEPLRQRGETLSRLFLRNIELQRVKEAKFVIAHNLETVKHYTNECIANGLEGTIVKDLSASYEFKRSKAWAKQKAVNSVSLEVIGVTEGTNKRKGKIGALVCKSSCGKVVVNVGSGLSDSDIELWTNKSPVGLIVEVLFNVLIKGENEDVYSLFLPRLDPTVKVRVDKTEADSLEDILAQHIGKPEV